jgi:hypothetical protein
LSVGMFSVALLAVVAVGLFLAWWAARPRDVSEPPVEVTAQKLYDEYRHGNVAAADGKYVGRTLRVTGRVLEVEQEQGGYGLGIETGPNVMIDGRVLRAAVVAALPAADRQAVAAIRDFDTVVVEGYFGGREDGPGRMGGISLRLERAKLVRHHPQPLPK